MSETNSVPTGNSHLENVALVWQALDLAALKRVCEMHETEFAAAYDLPRFATEPRWRPDPDGDFYLYRDHGSDILAVAHLDTVIDHDRRTCTFASTEDGPVVFSGALDDRLGAYIILELLPTLGIQHDILLTTGEESGQTTASEFFTPKDFIWGIEFDRGGTDVVMYQYEDAETRDLVRACGARVGTGSYSDIAYLDHLEVKCFNWGVGYEDYHGPRGHAWLKDTVDMVARYLKFHEQNQNEYLPHEDRWPKYSRSTWRSDSWWTGAHGAALDDAEAGEVAGEVDELYAALDEERECDRIFGPNHLHIPEDCRAVLAEMHEHDDLVGQGEGESAGTVLG